MHTAKVLHKLLSQSVPSIHASRLKAFIAAIQSLTRGAGATVTSLGRGLFGLAYDKHKIKRVDRLLSNAKLYQERQSIYGALTQRLLRGLSEVIIAIDWSPLCADQSWQLLRAAIPVGGCMRMLPGSHLKGLLNHENMKDENNVLFQGQTVNGVNEKDAILCALQPGEASFHHGWTLHASLPNTSNDRRIGLNVQYLRPSIRQLKHESDSALLVRGVDRYNHFLTDVPAETDLDPAALEKFKMLNKLYKEIAADGKIAS